MERTLKDEIIRLTNIKASAKIRSVWSEQIPNTEGRGDAHLDSFKLSRKSTVLACQTQLTPPTCYNSVLSQVGGCPVVPRRRAEGGAAASKQHR